MSISDELIKVLDMIGEKIGVAIDWTGNNVIPYVEQLCQKYIKWEIATSVTWMIIGVLMVIIAITLGIWADGFNDDMGFMVCVILLCIGLAVVGFQVFDIIECSIFPEKVIFEKVSYMINTAN